MRIFVICILVCCLAVYTLAIDEHRPKKKAEDRGKRNLEYQISHHYSGIPSYRLERRIATGPQYQNPQFYSRPYHKGRPQSYPVPPYAVQMEPLIHYSQRDPLYDTNILPLDPNNGDLLTENNHIQENVDRYGYHKPHYVERPVYIKEPEPIIEIIIKESNVSLPAPPPPPPPPKKKKEQVQVFYVKYSKNPNGYGKDKIVYDKPVPAISPTIPEEEPEEEPAPYYPESVTSPPPPSTTLRTIIKPDSEYYHSPSGVKVTFGKEGFDYDKRSSKPEDYVPPQSSGVLPQGRQLTSFSNAYYSRPSSNNYQALPPGFRSDARPDSRPDRQQQQSQPYRTINLPQSNYKPFGRQTVPAAQRPNYSFQSQQTFSNFPQQPSSPPQYSHSISHPPPPRFQAKPNNFPARQPVPYKPFDNFRPQQSFSQPSPIQFRPETHFSLQQQLPSQEQTRTFNSPKFNQQYNSGETLQQTHPQIPQTFQQLPNHQTQTNFRQPVTNQQNFQQQVIPQQQSLSQHNFHQTTSQHQQQNFHQQSSIPQQPQRQQPLVNQQTSISQQTTQRQQPFVNQQSSISQKPIIQQQPQQQYHQNTNQPQQNVFRNTEKQNFQPQQQNFQPQQQNFLQNEHLSNLQAAQNLLPPGGQLIPSVSKYEQHISSVEPASPQNSLTPQQYQQKIFQQFNQNSLSQEQSSQEVLSRQQTSSHQKRILDDVQRQQSIDNSVNYFQINNSQKAVDQQKKLLEEIEKQKQQQEQLRQFYQSNPDIKQDGFGTPQTPTNYVTRKGTEVSSTPKYQFQSTTTSTTTPAPPSTTTKDPKVLESQLPDEVPEELRQQLLSSGILNNADISILDYDKVGDIPLSALPPDQLANFYSAGGAAQLTAGSDPVPAVLQRDGSKVEDRVQFDEHEPEPAASEFQQQVVASPLVTSPSGVDMKVVHYDPATRNGQQVQEKYVEEEAHQVDPVVLNDSSYNRYLPLKINGTQFPIPDVPELRGKKISSVVVLAPISYDFTSGRKTRETTRELSKKSNDIEFIEGTILKELLINPSSDNFKRFLDTENKTSSDRQSVILLVADSASASKEKEIFMYDVATQTVSKLNGELSAAFVDAAEANSSDTEIGEASNIVETRVSYTGNVDRQDTSLDRSDLDDASSEIYESKVPIIDPLQEEVMETQASEHLETFVDVSGHPIDDLMVSSSVSNSVSKRNL